MNHVVFHRPLPLFCCQRLLFNHDHRWVGETHQPLLCSHDAYLSCYRHRARVLLPAAESKEGIAPDGRLSKRKSDPEEKDVLVGLHAIGV
jgi:hypothetical protein